MYDHLYPVLRDRDVEVVVHEDHPTLNRRVAELLAAGERIDVLATHSKYAPSQRQWLHPLDDLLAPDALAPLAPRAVELCRFDGALLCAPRLVDVRVLWARTDRVADGSRHLGRAARRRGRVRVPRPRVRPVRHVLRARRRRRRRAVRRHGPARRWRLRRRSGRSRRCAGWPRARTGGPAGLALRRRRRRAALGPGRRGGRVARRLGRDPRVGARRRAHARALPRGLGPAGVVLGMPRVGHPDDMWRPRRRGRPRHRAARARRPGPRRRGREHVRAPRRAGGGDPRERHRPATASRSPAPRSTPR